MTFTAGTKLGPYEIQSLLGSGGMGEVYRARDTRLDRDVAIKVLPASLAVDADRLRRFETEAKAVAALNHPNILSIHDIGIHDGVHYLVSECLEGQSLGRELSGGALPLRRVVQYGTAIAQGLAAAHDKGIIHRDLKPENIFVTREGEIKILDFGLAKLTQPAVDGPTLEGGPTSAGMVLGTVGYMSPEQVKGEPADARSDIFSLGTILYEMLSGQRAFRRDTSAETMTAILKEEPPELSLSGKPVSPAMERIVRRCLEKKPLQRFQSARDLAFNLEGVSGISASSAATALASPRKAEIRWVPLTSAVLVLAVIAVGSWVLGRRTASMASPVYRQLTFDRGLVYAARFATDGRTIYYSANWTGQPVQIYSTLPDSPESGPLRLVNSTLFAVSHSELAISVGCEDRYIGNCVGTLGEVPLAGGSPREIVPNVVAADWSSDYKEMAIVRRAAGKYAVEFPRGKTIYEGAHPLGNLRISPDGKALAFTEFLSLDGDGGSGVVIDRNGKQLLRSKTFTSMEGLAWSSSGKEVWIAATRTTGWADAIFGLALNGAERIVLRLPGMLRLHDVAPDGRVLLTHENWRSELQYRGPKDSQERNLSWLDYATLSDLSDDGSLIAFDDWGEASGLSDLAYVRKADGSPATKLGQLYAPVLSPDGRYVLTNDASQVGAGSGYLLVPTGTGDIQRIGSEAVALSPTVGFLPGGKTIYRMNFDGQAWRIFLQDVPSGLPHAIGPAVFPTAGAHFESHVASPDGKWIFAHDLSGQGTLYPIDGGSPHAIPGCQADDIWIRWSADAKSGYVYHDEKKSAPVFRIDVSSGKRDKVWTLTPGDPAGVTSIYRVRLSADGKTYAYSYVRELSDLFQVEGVR
jgi:eukaryotic-like serine/threonine-protein kinase